MRPRPFRLRLCLTLIAAAVATGLGGCRGESGGPPQVLVIGSEPKLADPRSGPLKPGEAILVNNVAQGLVRFDARGLIEPGLAEAWNVSDDGLSYIFRLSSATWPNGRKVTATQVARLLRRLVAQSSRNPLKDAFGAVDEIVPMTDRVLEIRLSQPRPHLLQLLAQPQMGLVYEGGGAGPFALEAGASPGAGLRLTREILVPDEEEPEIERVALAGSSAEQAVRAFAAGEADLVLGGTFADLPFARAGSVPRNSLRFDPASGLFGLVPASSEGPAAEPEVRRLLSAAIDRQSLIAQLAVPGLVPRTTVLEPGLDNIPDPLPPQWAQSAIEQRRAALIPMARRMFADDPPKITVALPDGPGSEMVFRRLAQDWGALGMTVERSRRGERADFKLIDLVAPSTSPAWFLRRFRCGEAEVCSEDVDQLLESARSTPVLDQRAALLLQASKEIDSLQLFIPIAAPIRWSLVSNRITGFAGNRFAVHTLTGLEQQLNRTAE